MIKKRKLPKTEIVEHVRDIKNGELKGGKRYLEENETSTLKNESISKRTKGVSLLINRAQTNGKYGIWGHDLEDLTIVNIMVKGNKIYLGVDS